MFTVKLVFKIDNTMLQLHFPKLEKIVYDERLVHISVWMKSSLASDLKMQEPRSIVFFPYILTFHKRILKQIKTVVLMIP